MELANAGKFVCCFEGEFSFVPTANLLTRIFRYAGFRQVQMFKATEICRSGEIDDLLPHFAELYRRNTAYWILKKS